VFFYEDFSSPDEAADRLRRELRIGLNMDSVHVRGLGQEGSVCDRIVYTGQRREEITTVIKKKRSLR
jgi:hypothetical protein